MSVPAGIFTGDWYENDPRWTAVDGYTMARLNPKTKPYHSALNAALEHSRDEGLPDIASYPVFCKLLALQCRASNVKNALEVGTLGGYTSIWIAAMNPQIHIDAVEVAEKHVRVAQENIDHAEVSDRITITQGGGLDVLPRFLEEIQQGKRERFGFTYIDADKENNWTYFDLAVKMSKPGATIYVDNIVLRGKLVDDQFAHDDDSGVPGARLLVENVGKDPRVEAVVQQIVAEKSYDGWLMAVVL